jgi:predicted enzyme related to lactoylglutathione lyase
MKVASKDKPMFEKVAFTMLPVKDMKRARAFYEKTLGFTVGSHSSNGIWTEYDLPRGGCFALFATQSAEPGGGGSLAFEVADLDELITELDGKGIYFEARMVHSPVCRMSILKDSEGNSLILHELASKRPIARPKSKPRPKPKTATAAPAPVPRHDHMPTLEEQPRVRGRKAKRAVPTGLKRVPVPKVVKKPTKGVRAKPVKAAPKKTKAKSAKKKKR